MLHTHINIVAIFSEQKTNQYTHNTDRYIDYFHTERKQKQKQKKLIVSIPLLLPLKHYLICTTEAIVANIV